MNEWVSECINKMDELNEWMNAWMNEWDEKNEMNK